MARMTAWIDVVNPGKCKCGATLQKGQRAEYDFPAQAYSACKSCKPAGEAPAPVPQLAPTAPPAVIPAPASPLTILEDIARSLAPAADVRRVVDAMLAAGVRAAWESGVIR